jgi:hypothetical protein
MSVKFFGQFLIERGEIDAGHLQVALAHMERVNLPLGQLARREGMLTDAAADRVNQRQRETDRPFGALAVEMGLLTDEQVQMLLQRQAEQRVPIGEALVHIGCLPAERLMPMLSEYKADQAAYQAGHAALPEGLSGLRAAEVVLDFLPKFCMRVARMRLKMGDFREVTAAPGQPHRVSVTLHGSPGLEIGLACDRPFALPVVAATCSQDAASLDDGLIDDGLGEFLNVIAGNAMSALEKESIHSDLGPPCLEAELREGWEFQTAAGEGKAWLVLRRV